MVTRIGQWTLDVQDVARMARFWAAALGYRIDDDGQHLGRRPRPGGCTERVAPARRRADTGQEPGPSGSVAGGDGAAEVQRLLALGARRVEVGQTGAEGFVVLADPEGNEFCVFREPRGG